MFTIQQQHLEKICEVNSFPAPSTGMVFFGFRGCLPVDTSNHAFLNQQDLNLTSVDYTSPRCTLGQWQPSKGTFAVFPGSTAPHISATRSAATSANLLMTGYYNDYRLGKHKAGKPTGHEAFKQWQGCAVRRDHNRDLKYDERDDRVEYEFPLDNLHAAWCKSVNDLWHASAGCQVVVGFPKCPKRGRNPEIGPWKEFRSNAYRQGQDRFGYILVDGQSVQQVVQQMSTGTKMDARLRFGSKGPLVTELQKALKAKGYYEGAIDDEFLTRTLRAVLPFQQDVFGETQDNGVVGPLTARELGLARIWPKF